ncbi:branched-chain amino acid transport system ATP-binding protein [Bradyrhizobium japonicum]|uniref:ABC transporter ATP-binding protein n=1 Tax=Bradyrhizobium TaxID=374 RepID=UPI00040B9F3B|nr:MULTISPECIES: ABC transporter ATP-binding protein [Bradyrhizobium]MCP1740149.1 ABC-type branched-subunit amino acid transport system ATPase component [Bradyrhizobium japonicum]MCP1778382.1 ABC-type branched-subunit amino acid transport system ATPase component [Bradyrhizobium japonicum]MCP1857825.1 ABC-type branched-subunit amino acid transport system ATPase component [Bradyrhizobium japonicum]MCP1888639.1 ABC-type branched-subunit amino acid transport system ATPase component [Bradyrhizobium 
MLQVSKSPALPATLLEIANLTKSFDGVKAVEDVSLHLREGIITTLVGPNGAGKTTLFNLITGHLRPTSGDIRWQGGSIVGTAPWKIARLGVARTFQDLRLFSHMTVFENVLTVMEKSAWFWQSEAGSGAERHQRVHEILEATGLQHKAGVRANDLAYAERKFLSMARIMATKAKMWLLDEPASGLDPRSYERFVALLRSEVRRGITICIIEHNLEIVVSISDRISFLDQGRLLADGEPEEILGNPELSSIYFGERNS